MSASDTMPTTAADVAGASPPGYLVLDPDGGERLRFLGDSTMRLKHDGGAGGDVAFYEYVSEPGVTGPPQHVHQGHDETFYVVEGQYEFTMGRERRVLVPGAFLYVPRGTPHTFRNAGDAPGRIVGTFNPARFASYFRELADLIMATGGAPDRDTWSALYGRYDTAFHDEGEQGPAA
jgi:mannose-6-phosphate isomerase-like protein (cupin superfamily)